MLFEKYAVKPTSWGDANKIFRRLSLQLHPDKGGDKKIYQQLVGEMDEWKKYFQKNILRSDDCSVIHDKLKKFDMWMKESRHDMISFARVVLATPVMIALPNKLRNEIFLSKVLILDVVSIWAHEWMIAYDDMHGERNIIMD